MAGPHKLLVANRGEIASRILRTARRLNIPTVAVYTRADATSPHVLLADEAVPLLPDQDAPLAYLDAAAVLAVCKAHGVTLVHPGYGFLSENEGFARAVRDAGIGWLGPRPETIGAMGLKHRARALAADVGVPLVPGSKELLRDADEAARVAEGIGYPVMLKSTAGGGGMGLVVCRTAEQLREKFHATQTRAGGLFHNDGLFLERYSPAGRHVEVQVFGDGKGHAIHFGERECSVQRRHQKVIEEAPSPFMVRHPDVRDNMCAAAVRLCEHVQYESAGTVEFLVDDATGEYFFLEMNTRLQVEHPVTECINPGLDIVELMILQGIPGRQPTLDQSQYSRPSDLYAIEARVYCENPSSQFKPSPGVLQYVQFMKADWLRVETWVESGTTVTPHYDPLVCKLIATGSTRAEAISRLSIALTESKVYGPPTNIAYLRAICDSPVFQQGGATTTFLDTFAYTPRAFDVLAGGVETTVQDYPGRTIGLGIPRSGPMDSLAFRLANALVGNDPGTEALEITLAGPRLRFHVPAVVSVTGAATRVTVDGKEVPMWAPIVVPAGAKFAVGSIKGPGFRAYLAVRGGFPEVPRYLDSKSTSMGLGGYQGRALAAGDQLVLGDCGPQTATPVLPSLAPASLPTYATDWTVGVLAGPQCDDSFVTAAGIADFFATRWTVSAASNRMGIRLEGPRIAWARASGGEGGSHPSNIHDNGYALGTVNLNGDTPVILTNEGPDMGGYVCLCTVASAERWKLGQLPPGATVRFAPISVETAEAMWREQQDAVRYLAHLKEPAEDKSLLRSRLHETAAHEAGGRPSVVYRQAGDSAILVEFGELKLDLAVRARVHLFETEVTKRGVRGIRVMAPCIRSTMSEILAALIDVERSLPERVDDMTFPARKIRFPVVLDDRWNREALERYMRATRSTASYLPSNIEYLARNNGLEGGGQEALRLLSSSDWLVLGVGFYLACPFLIPIDPRSRLVGQKMNPSRTYTPRGAIGIAGLVAAIYPIESPGGYQLYGRTLPPWQTWGKGADFSAEKPWLLRPFDQVAYEVVTEEEYSKLEAQFDAGQYRFKIEESIFSMAEYTEFVEGISHEVKAFKARQAEGVRSEEQRENELFAEWDKKRREDLEASQSVAEAPEGEQGGEAVTASLSAHVWKIKCRVGDEIKSGEDVLVVLEAMKTELPVEAGEENIGKKVVGFGPGVREGATVRAGDVLVSLG